MKRIVLFAFCTLCVAGAFTSCRTEEGLTPETSYISGGFGRYFEVVDRSCTVQDGCVAVNLKRNGRDFPEEWEYLLDSGDPLDFFDASIDISFLDGSGLEIDSDMIDIESNPLDFENLFYAGENEIVSLRFILAEDGARTFKLASECSPIVDAPFEDDESWEEMDSLDFQTDTLGGAPADSLADGEVDLSRFLDSLDSDN